MAGLGNRYVAWCCSSVDGSPIKPTNNLFTVQRGLCMHRRFMNQSKVAIFHYLKHDEKCVYCMYVVMYVGWLPKLPMSRSYWEPGASLGPL